ncbi:MAG TPA: class I SAM-dependent methyltransferase [Vicinamibacterales bacterium]|nr:class I SAM-dependent methyltransferase [Vicinamibacterales bacterium]
MTSDWNAALYHRLSGPQQAWGARVLARLPLSGGERVLDLGCGSGRLSATIAESLPRGQLVGLDASAAMLDAASAWLRERRSRARLVRGDGAALPFATAFDAVFSGATFHWILDHPRLFREIHRVLLPGGRLEAQCGGQGNLARLLERTHAQMGSQRYASFFRDWTDPWVFAGIAETTERLHAAGFVDVDVSLEPAPTSLGSQDAYGDFLACVCVRHHIERLPAGDRASFVGGLADAAARDDPPFTLDYWRLNISARRPVR